MKSFDTGNAIFALDARVLDLEEKLRVLTWRYEALTKIIGEDHPTLHPREFQKEIDKLVEKYQRDYDAFQRDKEPDIRKRLNLQEEETLAAPTPLTPHRSS